MRLPLKRLGVLPGLCLVSFSMANLGAQQHTGAPAGIRIPPPPPTPPAPPATALAPDAQHFRIRVMDGRTGESLPNAHVQVWYDEPAGPGVVISTGTRGDALMPAPVGEPIRILATVANLMDCRPSRRFDPPSAYSLADIAQTGVAAENTCGTISQHTRPGELVLFARKPRWYEGLNRQAR